MVGRIGMRVFKRPLIPDPRSPGSLVSARGLRGVVETRALALAAPVTDTPGALAPATVPAVTRASAARPDPDAPISPTAAIPSTRFLSMMSSLHKASSRSTGTVAALFPQVHP